MPAADAHGAKLLMAPIRIDTGILLHYLTQLSDHLASEGVCVLRTTTTGVFRMSMTAVLAFAWRPTNS